MAFFAIIAALAFLTASYTNEALDLGAALAATTGGVAGAGVAAGAGAWAGTGAGAVAPKAVAYASGVV